MSELMLVAPSEALGLHPFPGPLTDDPFSGQAPRAILEPIQAFQESGEMVSFDVKGYGGDDTILGSG